MKKLERPTNQKMNDQNRKKKDASFNIRRTQNEKSEFSRNVSQERYYKYEVYERIPSKMRV